MLRGFDHLMNLVLADVEEHYVVRLRTLRTKLRPAPGAASALGAPCPHSMPSLPPVRSLRQSTFYAGVTAPMCARAAPFWQRARDRHALYHILCMPRIPGHARIA